MNDNIEILARMRGMSAQAATHESETDPHNPNRPPDASGWRELRIAYLEDEIERLRAGYEAIKKATIDGRVCDDVAWFDTITTLHDFCDQMLGPA